MTISIGGARLELRFAILILIAACAAACNRGAGAGAQVDQPAISPPRLIRQSQDVELLQLQQPLPGLTLTKLHDLALPGVLETTGQITFDDRRVANIISRVTGRIEQVYVSQWDYVRRGQPIITLYSPDFMTAEAEYLQAEASAPALAGGPDNDQFARSMVEAARRKLELLGIEPAQIARIRNAAPVFTMYAPISGNVVQNQALRGSAVNPGDILYSVGTLEDVWITGDIYEDDLARVQVGQQLDAVTTAYPDEVFHGTIARISPNVDPNTHTLQIRCAVNNPGFKLKPQMLAQIKILVRPGRALIVSMDSLVFETDSYFAYVDAGHDSFARRKVVIASWDRHGYARVVSGLDPGDRVATGGTMQLNELWHEAHGERS
jgi:membrane fusion protein, copper/silver efflux system